MHIEFLPTYSKDWINSQLERQGYSGMQCEFRLHLQQSLSFRSNCHSISWWSFASPTASPIFVPQWGMLAQSDPSHNLRNESRHRHVGRFFGSWEDGHIRGDGELESMELASRWTNTTTESTTYEIKEWESYPWKSDATITTSWTCARFLDVQVS